MIVKEPEQKEERRFDIHLDTEPRVIIGYHIPPYSHQDNIRLSLIHSILSQGASSRLYKDLVLEKKIARTIFADYDFPGARYSNIFLIYAEPNSPHTTSEVEKAIYAHLEKLKSRPVSRNEIQKAINRGEALFYKEVSDSLSVARAILANLTICNDIDADSKKLQEIKKVTPQAIMETAKRIFRKSNRTVGTLINKQ